MSKKLTTKIKDIANLISTMTSIDEKDVNTILETYGKILIMGFSTNTPVSIPEIGEIIVELKENHKKKLIFDIQMTQVYRRRLIQNIKSNGSFLLNNEMKGLSKALKTKYMEG